MSACCRAEDGRAEERAAIRRGGDAGFTLIEILVALAILAAIVAVSLPQTSRLVDRLRFWMERDDVERQVADLGRRAVREGRQIDLAAVPAPRQGGRDLLQLPAGWRLAADPPVTYRHDGVCSGGTFTLQAGTLAVRYGLVPPFCRPERL